MNNRELVYKITSFIPKGKILTYATLAKLAGIKSPRVIGNILHQNTDPKVVPCHRVVNNKGEVAKNYAFGGAKAQLRNLKTEGIEVSGGRVDLTKCLWQPSRVLSLYFELLKKYGEPGPWPWFPSTGPSMNSGLRSGKVPSTSEEIAVGAILTQNTNWKNVEKALANLKKEKAAGIADIYKLGSLDFGKLKNLIRPSGFYNQKATRLFKFCQFIVKNYDDLKSFLKLSTKEAREKLLSLKGIGKETADTILLYAGERVVFVVDAYTKKFVKYHNLCKENDYDSLQKFFADNLPVDCQLYQDYHALIVRWGKEN